MKNIKLDHDSYHQYLEGSEVHCEAGLLSEKDLQVGEHILVFKDNTAAYTTAATPKREMQSNYIGVEGVITAVDHGEDEVEKVSIRKL